MPVLLVLIGMGRRDGAVVRIAITRLSTRTIAGRKSRLLPNWIFMCGYVTYTNRAKRKCLGVKKSTLKKEGAVSAKCAGQMAKGGAKAAKTDVCLSVTGLAGPGGGTEETPVGTVFMGCYCAGKTTVREFHFEGDRKSIRDQAVEQALTFICDRLRKYDR